MKIELLILVSDETTKKIEAGGSVILNSDRLTELSRRVISGIDDKLTKEITVQAIVGELMANPTKIVEALCADFAGNLMKLEPVTTVVEQNEKE